MCLHSRTVHLVTDQVSSTSATNCARIYNSSVSRQNEFPLQWPSPEVTLDHVWDTFIIISLLEDCCHRKRSLVVKRSGTQSERFNDAMAHRNQRMRSFRQPDARRHKCTKCCRVYEASTNMAAQFVRVVVVDGVTVSRPCCSVPYCFESLRSVNDRFCHLHMAEHGNQCAIISCTSSVTPGSKTCQNLDHKAVEALHALRGQSHFQLRERLERSRAIVDNPARAIPKSAVPVEVDGDMSDEGLQEFKVDHSQDHSKKKKLRAQFGRNRTHCEVLIIAPCGIIHDRRTFYRTEGVGSVAVCLLLYCRTAAAQTVFCRCSSKKPFQIH